MTARSGWWRDVKRAWVTFVVAGMFVVRMLSLLLMALLQQLVGGAEIRPA